ncbi:MAG: bL21 family ribosomal protein [Oscillospiraceae bacterium]|nr:bL21 family ribosomal protein [Oscillospiraceae bacterium]
MATKKNTTAKTENRNSRNNSSAVTNNSSKAKTGKAAKVRVYKMKPKKGYHRTQGHRQPYTRLTVESIQA